ncbi:unnamed protein product [Diatraea saccharalis]|uniref:Cuticle protein 3-like n=1 Tax=Diatraea saccharalis TaxID=40085 RepID=A0A9N9RG01_9NEOP|nr:unnamed protein product [Diatraea saccharalis]
MKLFVISAFIAVCTALPQGQYSHSPSYYQQTRPRAALDSNAVILRSSSDVNEQGFHYAYETDNGIAAEETGHEADGIQAQGGYSYTGDDGQVYSVRYTADSNGFQAQGAHIPTPPPVPEAIARALQENARDEAAGIYDDGSYHEGKYAGSGVVVARAYHQAKPYQQSAFRPRYY